MYVQLDKQMKGKRKKTRSPFLSTSSSSSSSVLFFLLILFWFYYGLMEGKKSELSTSAYYIDV
jgi:hypothetical protein